MLFLVSAKCDAVHYGQTPHTICEALRWRGDELACFADTGPGHLAVIESTNDCCIPNCSRVKCEAICQQVMKQDNNPKHICKSLVQSSLHLKWCWRNLREPRQAPITLRIKAHQPRKFLIHEMASQVLHLCI